MHLVSISIIKNSISIIVALMFITCAACSNQAPDNITENSNSISSHSISNLTSLDTANAYIQAINEFISQANTKIPFHFDTLYIGNPTLLPKINIPDYVAGKRIILLTEEINHKNPENGSTFVLINICWAAFEQNPIEFMFFTFYNGYKPQYKCFIYLKQDPLKKEFISDKKVRFEFPPFDKN